MKKNLLDAEYGTEYTVTEIDSDNDEMKAFLFTLGCYKGETVTVLSKISDNLVFNVKDARYSIDFELARCILVK